MMRRKLTMMMRMVMVTTTTPSQMTMTMAARIMAMTRGVVGSRVGYRASISSVLNSELPDV
jgi:hypothetical protein